MDSNDRIRQALSVGLFSYSVYSLRLLLSSRLAWTPEVEMVLLLNAGTPSYSLSSVH